MRHNIEQRLSELQPQTNCKEVQHYKQMPLVKSLLEVRQMLPQMWLQPTEKIAEHAKGNDDKKAIIIKELKSHLKGLIWKGRQRKEERDGFVEPWKTFGLEDFN